MVISHTKKFIFIKPMKIAGTSMQSKLRRHCDRSLFRKFEPHNHETFSEIQLELPNKLEEYFVFSFVRNPWSRLVSLFFHLRKKSNILPGIKRYKKFDKNAVNFLMHPFRDFDSNIPKRYMSFYDHLKNLEGKIDLDFIGKMENLQEDFDTVCDKIGIPRRKLRRKNKTKHKHYTEYYDDETREIVAKKYAKDIEHFNYKFGE